VIAGHAGELNLRQYAMAARYTRCMPRPVRAWLTIALVACGALLAACSSVPTRSPDSSTIIYVIKRSWHVDIGFASADLQPPLASLRTDFANSRYLLFGFGDRHYLLDKDRGFGGMLAAFWPGAGLMLVTGLGDSMQAAFGEDNVIEIPVTEAQARMAQQFVWQSLTTDRGSVAPLRAGPYEGSLYYAASKGYSGWHTCNTWAAEGLHAAGLPVHSFGVAFAGQLWIQARRLDAH
jgi:Protein of unknown function (DUF2459)